MKKVLRRLYQHLRMFGIDPIKGVRSARAIPGYWRDMRAFRRCREQSVEKFSWGDLRPCLEDRSAEGGTARGHYFHQDLLVARRVCLDNPRLHADVGSRFDGFVAHVASFRDIEVFDIRPLNASIHNVTFRQADFMSPLREDLHAYCDSLSCLHAIEHFGLGRYGDPIMYEGHLRAIDNFHQMLATDGKLYLSTPIGPQRIEFNAHRVFSVGYLLKALDNRFRVERFSYVDDRGDLHEDVALTQPEIDRNFGCNYGCGIFELRKV